MLTPDFNLFYNKEAFDILTSLSSTNLFEKDGEIPILPKRLVETCRHLFNGGKGTTEVVSPLIFEDESRKIFYAFRTIPLGLEKESNSTPSYVLILIEKVKCQPTWAETFNLTKREREVIRLIMMGYTSKEIADELCIAKYTAEDHIKNISRKLGVKNRVSLVLKLLTLLR